MILEALVCIFLGAVVYKKGILDFSGSLTAVVMGVLIWSLAGLTWFFLLVIFMFLGFISTMYKYELKQSMKVSEEDHGKRRINNVLANGLIPAFITVLGYANSTDILKICIDNRLYIASYIAAIATVTGDTLSSEIGVLSKNDPVLITSFKKVAKGTHGAVSPLGEIVGIFGVLLIGLIAWAFGMLSIELSLASAVIGGTAGFHMDSFLGAVFERRQLIGNATVNFLSAVTGSIFGFYVVLIL